MNFILLNSIPWSIYLCLFFGNAVKKNKAWGNTFTALNTTKPFTHHSSLMLQNRINPVSTKCIYVQQKAQGNKRMKDDEDAVFITKQE